MRRRAPSLTRGPSADARRGEVERALEMLGSFVALAERMSLVSYHAVRAARRGSGDQR